MSEKASSLKIKAFFSKFPFLKRYVQKKNVRSIDFEIVDLTEVFLDQVSDRFKEIYFFGKNGEKILQVGIGSCSKKSLFVRIVRCFVLFRIEYETVGEALERALKEKNEEVYFVVFFVVKDCWNHVYDVHVMQLREKFSEALVKRLVAKRLEEIEALRWLHEEV